LNATFPQKKLCILWGFVAFAFYQRRVATKDHLRPLNATFPQKKLCILWGFVAFAP
jgi:hypothetical protein